MISPPVYLVSVNKTPARAASLVDQLLTNLKLNGDVVHVANAPTVEDLQIVLDALVTPAGILICSSQWSPEEQQKANTIAKGVFPEIKMVNIPPGLDQREGSVGILAFLKDAISRAIAN
ncbi:hypothetical protein B0I35DRAFT_514867 [Stachybotrys elegans]|uniref:Uncharacterized protein n=1 Tax=Stachybotrys elegans TaxID=80388 RepID=A0A8K0SKV5_9HYPO|nr:hypothetical protein B0I35DRAFT_514867 [Stachybotrys elegans]